MLVSMSFLLAQHLLGGGEHITQGSPGVTLYGPPIGKGLLSHPDRVLRKQSELVKAVICALSTTQKICFLRNRIIWGDITMATGDPVNKSHLERISSNSSTMSFISVGSDILSTVTTANCEIALLPLNLLIELQPNYLTLEDGVLTSNNYSGGLNLFSDGNALIDGRQCRIINYIQRKVTLQSHADYKDYRETLLSKPMLFITNAKKVNSSSTSAKTFAIIINTRHPQIRTKIEKGMNDAISSVMGENYQLQFTFFNNVKEYLEKQNFELTEDNLSFSYTFKLDVLVDFFYMFGLSKKNCDLQGKILNLHCTNNSRKERVKVFLSKMTSPLIRLGSSLDHDRRPSVFSLDMIMEDPFPQEENVSDSAPVLPLNS